MGCEWARTTLAQAGVTLIDCDHRTPPASEAGYPYIAIPQLKDGRIDLNGVRRISAEHYADWTKKLKPQAHDVIVVRRCNSGDSAVVPGSFECAIGQNLVVLRADGTKVFPAYLRWLLRGPDWWNEVGKYINVGAVFDSLRCRDIPNFEVAIPPIDVQCEIASFLDEIDDRIDLLRQTNTTLEAIAQALFKSWFVDFDPVHAKAEGREPEAMDAATAAPLPSEFEESELGLIPKGWDVEPLGGAANVIDCLHAKKPELLDNGRPYLQLNCIRSDGLLDVSAAAAISDDDYEKWTSRIEAKTGDCVITNVGRVGAVAQIPCNYLAAIGRNMTAVRCKSTFPYPTVLIELLTSDFMRHEIEQKTDAGTILAALNVKNIPKLRFVRGADEILQKFETLCRPLRAAMEENLQRANLLASLRDTLLPRLISGKLRLPETTEAVEAALA